MYPPIFRRPAEREISHGHLQAAIPGHGRGKDLCRTSAPQGQAKDLAAGDLVKGDTRKGYALFASICGVPLAVIEELDLDDLTGLGEALQPFLGRSGSLKAEEVSPSP